MVTFTPQGRMGNYLFELATAMGYAFKNNIEYTAPFITLHEFWNPIYLKHLQNPKYNPNLPQAVIREYQHQYQELPFNESWRDVNIVLSGYWQTEKYFKNYRQQILDAFNYEWNLNKGLVSVHVRRGDYITFSEKHPAVPVEWYEEAMSMFPDKKFVFFSDDIEWCKENFKHRNDCSFSEGRSIEEDLIEISQCEHHINSSSTYSWWGAWLNRNEDKKIYTPKLWFTENWGNLNVDDIVPETWIKL